MFIRVAAKSLTYLPNNEMGQMNQLQHSCYHHQYDKLTVCSIRDQQIDWRLFLHNNTYMLNQHLE